MLFSQQASALQMNPLSVVVKPTGGGARQSFKVTNESNEPIAVQFSVMTRQQVNNKEVRRPADKDFMIYPPQAIIPPKSTQKVRIQWLGKQKVTKELSYRLIAEQVYVSLKKEKQTGINMLMTLVGALYVQPNNTKSNVTVKAVQRQGNKLAITLANSGTRHQLMRYATLSLKNGSKVINLKGNSLAGLDGNNILAGSTKRFFIPVPKGFVNGRWSATVKYPK
ncbi:MAG TPA: molecular chaperone [Leucothrix sp.]|nr:molecular chaperone [Leucothrix sp.]